MPKKGWWCVAWITLWPGIAVAEGPGWNLQPSESWLVVRLGPKPSGLFSGLAHPHVVRAVQFSGKLSLDPADLSTCALTLEIPVAGLRVDHPEDRKRAGLGGGPDADDQKKITAHMRDEDQLYAASHPTIQFTSERCRKDGVIEGTLKIRGKSKKVIVPMKIESTETKVVAKGEFQLQHADFGFEPYSAAFGTISNAEALRFTIELVAERVTRP